MNYDESDNENKSMFTLFISIFLQFYLLIIEDEIKTNLSLIENILKTNDLKEPSTSSLQKIAEKNAVNDTLTETEFQVKIADLGNACWTVSC